MSVRPYLPSAQFVFVASSMVLSAGLVYAAERYTAQPQAAQITSVATDSAQNTQAAVDWQASLASIQQNTTPLPTPPNQDDVNALVKAAQTSNVTSSVSRTLLINLANAKAQGLGSDIPTQNQLIEDAVAQISPSSPPKSYAKSDLQVVADSTDARRAYGNAVMAVLNKHPNASMANTLLAISQALDANSPDGFQTLKPIEAEYRALLQDLAAVAVPQTLVPFHVQLLDDFSQIDGDYAGMELTLTDPIRGLAALQQYRGSADEASRVFINIAQALTKGDILWTKDEPGASWASLLSTQ